MINVLDHLDAQGVPDLQAALDAARDGVSVYLPGDLVYQAPPGGLLIRRRIELFGDGPGKKDSPWGTMITPANATDPVLVLDAEANQDLSFVHLHDFRITRPAIQPGRYGGDGIQYRQPAGAAQKKLSQLRIERVAVHHLTGSAFAFVGVNGGESAIVDLHMEDCAAEDCKGYGIHLAFGFGALVKHCLLRGNGRAGLRAVESGVAVYQVVADGNTWDIATAEEASLHFVNCHTARVDACRILDFTVGAGAGVTKRACISTSDPGGYSGGSFVIGGCYIEVASGTSVRPGDGIHVPSSEFNGPLLVLPNRFLRVSKLVDVGADVTGCVLFPQFDGSSGSIVTPNAPNVGLVALPGMNRSASNTIAGLIVPATGLLDSGLPSLSIENGTMAWNNSDNTLRAFVGGVWRTVVVGA